jgi:hypothetical protein
LFLLALGLVRFSQTLHNTANAGYENIGALDLAGAWAWHDISDLF